MKRNRTVERLATFFGAALLVTLRLGAQTGPMASNNQEAMHHEHLAAGAPVSFAELEATVNQLNHARKATEKYQDVNVAKAEGYIAIGPYVPGMGFHFVKGNGTSGFDLEHPPILLYEKDGTAAEKLRLVGVSYLLRAAAGPDGQPVQAPFPRGLASWHKHANICLFSDNSVATNLDATQCEQRGGRFTAETEWMIHAWIWKDSPAGVFSPSNPNVR